MDPLSDLLSSVRARTTTWVHVDAGGAWGVALPESRSTFFVHHLVRGTALLSAGDEAHPIALTAGDVAVVPRGAAHALRDRKGTTAVPLDEPTGGRPAGGGRVWQVGRQGTSHATMLTSACIELEDPFSIPIVSSLPSAFLLTGNGPGRTSLGEQLRLLGQELETRPFGSDFVLDHVGTVLFAYVLRAYVESMGEAALGPEAAVSCRSLEHVSALRDPGVATALALISQEPEHPWTVASLAKRVGVSRSAFAARFTQLVGESPLAYLTRMRMQKAAVLLREGATLARTSELTGYATEASFGHAFRQWAGMSPGAWRRKGDA